MYIYSELYVLIFKHFLPAGGFVYNISAPSHISRWHAFRDCKEFSMLKRHP